MAITISKLHQMMSDQDPITMLTCTDASFASIMEAAGLDSILIGDSLGMVVQGHNTTIPVTVEQIAYHLKCVSRGCQSPFIVADLPYGTYNTLDDANRNSCILMQEGAHMVKLEGGSEFCSTIEFLATKGIPVCAHIGLTPQSFHMTGSYKIQGQSDEQINRLLKDAKSIENAGALMMVLELMPTETARQITDSVSIPTIGIGAGNKCDGQILNIYDILGVSAGRIPKFAKNFLNGQNSIRAAIDTFISEVKLHKYPSPEHSFD